jgi:hypothetical protein
MPCERALAPKPERSRPRPVLANAAPPEGRCEAEAAPVCLTSPRCPSSTKKTPATWVSRGQWSQRPAVDRYFKRPHTQGYGKAVACSSESCPKIGTIPKARFFPLAALVPSAGTKIFQIELYAVRHAHPCADPSARPLTKGEKPCKFPRN